MSKLIRVVNLDEVKELRITCLKCGAFWSVPIPLTEETTQKKCFTCSTVIPRTHLEHVLKISDEIESIRKHIKDFSVSIELEMRAP